MGKRIRFAGLNGWTVRVGFLRLLAAEAEECSDGAYKNLA